jgi:hypothetical protein
LKKSRKTHFCVKTIDLFWKKIQFISGYSNFFPTLSIAENGEMK